jgi:hypothetical protein
MTLQSFRREAVRKLLAGLACFVLVSSGAPALFAQAPTATFAGVILTPSGLPAAGFKAVFRDVVTNQVYMSSPTDAAGNYSVQVPVGSRYKLDNVVADDGVTKLPVQDVPPVAVRTPGTNRLNVRFTQGPAPATPPPVAATKPAPKPAPTDTARTVSAPPKKEEKNKKGGAPWYKRPGPIVGIVLGSAAVVALAVGGGGGGGSTPASPSTLP